MPSASYAETKRLRQVTGVGALTALAFVLVLEDHRRFKKSRNVGPFLGLTPRQDESGQTRKQLRITKAHRKTESNVGNPWSRMLPPPRHFRPTPDAENPRLFTAGLLSELLAPRASRRCELALSAAD